MGGYPSPSGKGGQKGKQKAGQAGDQKDKLPCEYHSGKVKRQRRGKSPAGRVVRPLSQCRAGSAPGMQGAKPLA